MKRHAQGTDPLIIPQGLFKGRNFDSLNKWQLLYVCGQLVVITFALTVYSWLLRGRVWWSRMKLDFRAFMQGR